MMTFAQFQATGRDESDLGAALSFDTGQEAPVPGRIYADAYYIEDTTAWADGRPRWYLLIDRNEWFSDDIATLERRLYLYTLGEDSDALNELVELGINALAKAIQDAIGQTHGDIAGHFFSGGEAIRDQVHDYIIAETHSG